MSVNSACYSQCRSFTCNIFYLLPACRVYSHVSLQRPTGGRSTSHFTKNSDGITSNSVLGTVEQRLVLKETPPQTGVAFQQSQRFAGHAIGLAANVRSVGTARASLKPVSTEGAKARAYQEKKTMVNKSSRSRSGIEAGLGVSSSSTQNAGKLLVGSTGRSDVLTGSQVVAHGAIPIRRVSGSTASDCRASVYSVRRFRASEFARDSVLRRPNSRRAVKSKTRRRYRWCSTLKGEPIFSISRNVVPTPSGKLLAALPPAVQKALAPHTSHKTDLSLVATRWWENTSYRRKARVMSRATVKATLPRSSLKHPTRPTSLSTILSDYILESSISHKRALLKLHKAEIAEFLRSKRCGVGDVLAWSRILSFPNADRVVIEFMKIASRASSSDQAPLPTFLLMLILRSKKLKAPSLRLLLDYIWKHYIGQLPGFKSEGTAQVMNQQTAMVMVVRLIRHARVVWPNGLEEIAALSTGLVGPESENIDSLGRQSIQSYSHLYNRLLSLFSMPTSLGPFQSVAIQKRCQFNLIRKMINFKPHLTVTREGFRALAKVGLAHRKTEAERSWATSKALSWPPWKEELLGIDAGSEDPGQNSRAANVLSQMTEAGYSHLVWEKTARILAGWDTDSSPTIQTRALVGQAPIMRNADIKLGDTQSRSAEHEIWAARIVATRTVKEAWACFTSYEECIGETHALKPYDAMFAKLLYAAEQDALPDWQNPSVVPGDAKETWPEPTSPHDFLYVPSDPPSVAEFFERMKNRGLRPRKRLLRELLENASTLADGFKYIDTGSLSQAGKGALLGMTQKRPQDIRALMRRIGDHLVTAFVRLLCRAPPSSDISFILPRSPGSHEETCHEEHTQDPFLYAQHFVAALQPSFRPIWYALFHGWKLRICHPPPRALDKSWRGLLHQLRDIDALGIDLDFDSFRDLGEILEEVALSHHYLIPSRQERRSWGGSDPRSTCVLLCKCLFNAMAYGGSIQSKHDIAQTTSWLPTVRPSTPTRTRTPLLGIPNPAILHRTIRILGFCQDYRSIITLLGWMHCFASELGPVAAELANSRKLTRHTMAAVGYFLTESWRDEFFEEGAASMRCKGWSGGQWEMLQQAREIVELHRDDWGGWATEQEVAAYHVVNRAKARRMRVFASSGGGVLMGMSTEKAGGRSKRG